MLVNYEQKIEQMLSGQLPINEFMKEMQEDVSLLEYVRRLIPVSVQNAPYHPCWKGIHYDTYKALDFDMIQILKHVNGFSASLGGNLNAYSVLSWAYRITHPTIQCTKKYDELFDLYLDATQDCYDGVEVNSLVVSLVESFMSEKSKTKRIKNTKEAVRNLFHVTGRNRPHWIQGPEWPMGKNSPMEYLSRKRDGERVVFNFRDVDTGEIREVEQFY